MKSVCLGMPGYGDTSPHAARAFWCATGNPDLRVSRQYMDGSLLARVFNQLWCWALNDEDVTHFAMLHSDIEPPDGWLDVLLEELETHDLDVLSCVVPIKTDTGLTSTALHKEGDNWEPLCRLTMREVFDLPETFTSKDTGFPLLLNTGCWVCRFDREWATQVHFEINDRIVFNKSKGKYEPQVEPEDWFFSRLCNEMNLKIGATRKLKLNHRGQALFTNSDPWGSAYDEVYVNESLVSKPEIIFPYDVAGWLLPEEGYALAEICKGKEVLEIGSYLGKSTICIAQTANFVDSVDTHDGRGTPYPQNTYQPFRRNLIKFGIENVRAFVGETTDFEWDRKYDVVFIDGAHDYESVCNDIELAVSVLVDDGVIVFHDYQGIDPGVDAAVDDFIADGAELLSTHGSVAVVLPPAKVLMEI